MDNKAVFENMFNKNFSDDGNATLLRSIANEHPYFTAAQFYLLQQTAPGSDEFTKQAAKTSVLFNNSYWLNFQLQQTNKQPTAEPETSQPAIIDEDTNHLESNTAMKFELKIPDEKPGDETLSFEPMHLVDYFASQGIKLSEEEQPTDKLGKQLKSFTEWLKTMKKLPGQNASGDQSTAEAEKPAEGTDINVQALAEKSNLEEEVVTEAMAAVLASQGKRGKAAELYQKLSLMNPSKSAYFAAKIEQLKDN